MVYTHCHNTTGRDTQYMHVLYTEWTFCLRLMVACMFYVDMKISPGIRGYCDIMSFYDVFQQSANILKKLSTCYVAAQVMEKR